jgi:hypothetical protein
MVSGRHFDWWAIPRLLWAGSRSRKDKFVYALDSRYAQRAFCAQGVQTSLRTNPIGVSLRIHIGAGSTAFKVSFPASAAPLPRAITQLNMRPIVKLLIISFLLYRVLVGGMLYVRGFRYFLVEQLVCCPSMDVTSFSLWSPAGCDKSRLIIE